MRKADLSINVLIIAAIGIVVMIIVIAGFSGKFKGASREIESCAVRGGTCEPTACSVRQVQVPNAKCDEGKVCCLTYRGDENDA